MLFPRPRQSSRRVRGRGRAVHRARQLDASLPAEGFALDIGASWRRHLPPRRARPALRPRDLDQLVAEHPAGLPGLSIRDWPDFPVRGYMLDVSRDRVPTRGTLTRLVGVCALGADQPLRALYRAHVPYADHEVVWRDASPMTADDIRWLDDTCAAAGHRAGGEPELLRPHGSLARARSRTGAGRRRPTASSPSPGTRWRRRCSPRLRRTRRVR